MIVGASRSGAKFMVNAEARLLTMARFIAHRRIRNELKASGLRIASIEPAVLSRATSAHNLAQEFESLAGSFGCLSRQTGNVAAGLHQTGDQAAAHWVRCHRKDNRDERCRLLCREDCTSHRDNDIDLEPDELGR